ncbi:hypothetical protein MTO96_051892, partial [Rhipicephalus appendiculatus]
IIGHEMMHGFDVNGIQKQVNKEGEPSEFVKEYTKRAICLRKSHKSVLSLSGQQEMLNDTVDSENLADLGGDHALICCLLLVAPEIQGRQISHP